MQPAGQVVCWERLLKNTNLFNVRTILKNRTSSFSHSQSAFMQNIKEMDELLDSLLDLYLLPLTPWPQRAAAT